MANWKIEYDLLDRDTQPSGAFQRNARFVALKWRRDDVADRSVVVIPIQRTVPANELTQFKKFIGINQLTDVISEDLPKTVINHVSRILGKDASMYKRICLKSNPQERILVGMKSTNDYSQFHFGAGEASIIEMVSQIEDAPDYSLVIIEEIENGLHPIATLKMVEYLFDVAKRKRCQVIFTTHSEAALTALPPKAIWACIDGSAYHGKLTIESLRAITGVAEKDKVIFVEDDFAKDPCEELLRQMSPDALHAVAVHKAGGYPYVVEVAEHHNKNPTIKSKAVALIDGDNPATHDGKAEVIRIPGSAPETLVFGFAHDKAESISALIQQRCQCPTVRQDAIVAAIQKVILDTTDHHLFFKKLGEEIGYISEIIIRRGLCSIFVEQNRELLKPTVEALRSKLGL